MWGSVRHRRRRGETRGREYLPAVLLLCAVCVGAALGAEAPWPMHGHDAGRTGQSEYAGPDGIPEQAWCCEIDHLNRTSSFTIGPGGTLYVNGWKGLYAIGPDGVLRWTHETPGRIWPPAVGNDGTIYAGLEDGRLCALTSEGDVKWHYQTAGEIRSAPLLVPDGTVYFGSLDGHVYAVTPAGALRWRHDVGARVESSPALGRDGSVLAATALQLYAFSPDGAVRWTLDIGTWDHSSSLAVAEDGTIYVASTNYVSSHACTSGSGCGAWREPYLHALWPDGTPKWKYRVEGEEGDPFGSLGLAADGTIYAARFYLVDVSGRSSDFMALGPDGSVKWQYERDCNVFSAPAIGADGTIYVYVYVEVPQERCSQLEPGVYALRPDGSIKWSVPTLHAGTAPPVIGSDGKLYVGFQDDDDSVPSWGDRVCAMGPSETAVQAGESPRRPEAPALSQNLPNPFNNRTTIWFAVGEPGEVELAVYNLGGQRVVTLSAGTRAAGNYTVTWDGNDDRGSAVSTGVYVCRLVVGGQSLTRKLVLLK